LQGTSSFFSWHFLAVDVAPSVQGSFGQSEVLAYEKVTLSVSNFSRGIHFSPAPGGIG
jgi:hypothetical protein